ncbi:MAG: cytochrome c oxidase assembly protein [Novosphingobium sp.]|nr:cytochrome c oxidase assembly protein [Novosphingobium sp.]
MSDPSRNRRTAFMALGVAVAMLGLGYASVPLYRLFCQVTGFGGTTQRVGEAQAAEVRAVAGKSIVVRFDGNVARGLPWKFGPDEVTRTVAIGERSMTTFHAKNNSARSITGTATFNVMPEQAGKHFSKIQCFCFTEQTLKPGEEVRMPVIFYVDPKILDDPSAKDIGEITLSYTFNEARYPASKPLDPSGAAR